MNNKKRMIFDVFWSILFIASLVLFDRFTKIYATNALQGKKPFVIIKNVFEFNYLEGGNKGAAWGMLNGQLGLLSTISIILFIIIGVLSLRVAYIVINNNLPAKYNILRILLLCIMAGALGNLIDRLFQGYVIDFIYFKLINFPVFNVADCYVVVATIIIALMVMFGFTDSELEVLVGKKTSTDDNKDIELITSNNDDTEN